MVEVEFAVDLEYELVAGRKGWIEIEMEWWLGLGLDLDNGQVDHVAPHEEKVVGATKNDLKSKVTTTIINILNYPQNEFEKWCFLPEELTRFGDIGGGIGECGDIMFIGDIWCE